MRHVSRSCIFCTVLALAALMFASPASAQSVAQAKTWTISPFLGTSAGISDDNGASNSLALGVGIGYDLTPNVGFEGEVGYLFDVAGETDLLDWSVTNVSGNFVYHFDARHVTPYGTFGIGFEHSGLDASDPAVLVIPSSTEIAFNFGGGVKYPVTPRLLVRGDVRRFQANDLAPDYWRLYGGLTFTLGR